MTKLKALVGLSFRALLFSFQVGGSRKRAGAGWAALALMCGLCLYLSGTYSFLLAGQLAGVGGRDLLFLTMPMASVVAGLLFTLFAVQGVVFGGRDVDQMLSLPVSSLVVLLSRVLALYLENLVVALVILLPAGTAWLWYGGGGGIGFVFRLVIGGIFLALIPTVLALVGGFLLSWCASRVAHKNVLVLILYAALTAGALAVSLQLSMAVSSMAAEELGMQIEGAFAGWGLPFQLFRSGVLGDGAALGGLCLLGLLPLIAVCAVFAPGYQRILTGLNTHRKRMDYRLGRLSASSSRKALLKKEAARFFGSPMYLLNTGIGLILLVIAGVAAVAERKRMLSLLAQPGMGELPRVFLAAVAVNFLLSTTAITGSSISLEGRNLWILKEAPVAAGEIFLVKAGFQVLLTLPCLAIGAAGLALGLELSWVEGAAVFGLGLAFSGFTTLMGLVINLCHPKLDALNDTVVVKQSMASMLTVFSGMTLAALTALAGWVFRGIAGGTGGLSLCGALLLVGCGGMALWLRTRGVERFRSL